MKRLLIVALALSLPTLLQAQTMYVDDTLYLGFYNEPDGSGSQFTSAPSGTKLTLIEERGGYSLVRTEKGTAGWVKSKYLVDAAPAIVRIKALEKISERADALALEVDSLSTENTDLRREAEVLRSRIEKQKQEFEQRLNDDDKQVVVEHVPADAAVDQAHIVALNSATVEALQALEKFTAAAGVVDVEEKVPASAPTETDIESSEQPTTLLNVFSEDDQTTMAWEYIVDELRAINIVHYVLIGVALGLGFLIGTYVLDRRIRQQHGGYRIW